MGTGRIRGSSRAGTAARPMTALRAAGYTSAARDTPLKDDRREDRLRFFYFLIEFFKSCLNLKQFI